jgi:hypothetical protein
MRRHEHLVRPGRQASLPASFSRNAREAGCLLSQANCEPLGYSITIAFEDPR